MKFSIIIATASILLFSCGTEPSEEKPALSVAPEKVLTEKDTSSIVVTVKDTLKPIPVEEFTYSYLMPEETILLGNYLLEGDVQSLDSSLVVLSEAQNDTLVVEHFLNLIRVTDSFKDSAINHKGYLDPMEAADLFETLPNAILGFENSCMAECTEYDVAIKMEPFYALANKTDGTLDDEFFELIQIMNGEKYTSSYSFKNWFAQFWDYGGATLLGDSTHYNFLVRSQKLNAKTHLAEPFINRYIVECGNDMLHGIYMYAPEKVMAEMDLILDLNVLNEETTGQLIQLKAVIQSGDYTWKNSVGGMLQFNCITADCDFGG